MVNPQRALLVGSSFSAAPIFFALKRHGLHVSVCGNLAADPCHQYSDESFYIDYSKPSELMRLVEEHGFDYIIPSCNDYAYMSCALVAEKFDFYGFDKVATARTLHTKSDFRQMAESLNLSVPKFVRQKEGQPLQTQHLQFPLLVKPIDSFSGRGMSKVVNVLELQEAVDHALDASRSSEVVLEEFIDGTLHSHSAFIEDNKVVLDFFVDEFCTVYPYQVNCSNHPSVLSDHIQDAVREEMNRMASHLKLNDGLLHTQFIVAGDEFSIIECMRRGPGDLYGSMIELSTGVDYADLYIRPFLNLKMPKVSQKIIKHVGRHTISRNKPLVNFSFSVNVPEAYVDIATLKGSGEKLGLAPFDKLAILFAEFSSREKMFATAPYLADFVKIRTLGDHL